MPHSGCSSTRSIRLGAPIRLRRKVLRCVEHRLAPGVDVVLGDGWQHRRTLPPIERRQLRSQLVDSRPVVRDDRSHRDTQRRGQCRNVDPAAAGGQFVAHRQRQQTWPIQPQHLADQQDRPAQRSRIGDQHQRVGRIDAGVLAGQQVGHHLLVWTDRVQAVGTGQILDGNRDAVDAGGADAASHGDARVVAGLGA